MIIRTEKYFFACLFHPLEKQVVRHRAAIGTGLKGRLVRNHPSHYSQERLTIFIDSIFFRFPSPTPSVSPADGGGSTFPCQGKDLRTMKDGVVDGKPRYAEICLFYGQPKKSRPLRVLCEKQGGGTCTMACAAILSESLTGEALSGTSLDRGRLSPP